MATQIPRGASVFGFAIAAALLIVLGAIAWLLIPPSSPERLELGSQNEAEADPARPATAEFAPDPADATAGAESMRTASESEPPARLDEDPIQDFVASGRVLTMDDQPVAGVEVLLIWSGWPNATAQSIEATNQQGEFLAAPLQAGDARGQIHRAAVLHPDWIVHSMQVDHRVPDCTVRVAPADAWLPVRLIDELTGQPSANLPIRLVGEDLGSGGVSDANGRVRLAGVSGLPLSMVTADGGITWLSAPNPLILDPGLNPELEVRVRKQPTQIDFRAVDDRTGAPIDSAQWYANAGEGKPLLHTGANFAWDASLHPTVVGTTSIHIEADGFLDHTYSAATAPKVQPVEIRMARVSLLEVSCIFTKQGRAVAEHEFWLSSEERFRTGNGHHVKPAASAQSDASGHTVFQLEWPEGADPPREVRLTHGHTSYTWLTSRLGPQPWRIELEPPMATLQFRFRDGQGQPVIGRRAMVRLQVGEGGPLIYSAQASWRWYSTPLSNADGLASVEIPAEIGFAWKAGEDGVGDLTKTIPGEPLAPREVRTIDALDASAGDIVGKLRFPEGWSGGNQIFQLELLAADGDALQDEQGRQPDWARAGVGGFGSGLGGEIDTNFRFERVPHGSYLLRYVGATAQQAPLAVQTGQEGVIVEMPAPCVVELEFVDADTQQHVNAKGFVVPNVGWHSTIEGGRGTVRFLPAEAVTLRCFLDGYLGVTLHLGAVPEAGTTLNRVVELQTGRALELRPQRSEVSMEEHGNYWTYLLADGSIGPPLNRRYPAPQGNAVQLEYFPVTAFTLVHTTPAGEVDYAQDVPANTERTRITVDYPQL